MSRVLVRLKPQAACRRQSASAPTTVPDRTLAFRIETAASRLRGSRWSSTPRGRLLKPAQRPRADGLGRRGRSASRTRVRGRRERRDPQLTALRSRYSSALRRRAGSRRRRPADPRRDRPPGDRPAQARSRSSAACGQLARGLRRRPRTSPREAAQAERIDRAERARQAHPRSTRMRSPRTLSARGSACTRSHRYRRRARARLSCRAVVGAAVAAMGVSPGGGERLVGGRDWACAGCCHGGGNPPRHLRPWRVASALRSRAQVARAFAPAAARAPACPAPTPPTAPPAGPHRQAAASCCAASPTPAARPSPPRPPRRRPAARSSRLARDHQPAPRSRS